MAVDEKCEVLNRGEKGFGSGDEEFCFTAVEFQEIIVHPGFDVGNAV